MKKLFNEFGFSFVVGDGNWIGASYEIEDGDNEIRKWGFKKFKIKDLEGVYFRIWFFNKVFILSSNNGLELKNKNKYGFKLIFGLQINF